MVNFSSPGVYVVEKDLSNYPTSINPSVVGVVGFADQGPINKPKLITSQESLLQLFGNPTEQIPGQGLEGAIEILETTNSMYYIRAADAGTAADASSTVQIGACPAFIVSAYSRYDVQNEGSTRSDGNAGMTGGNSLYLTVQIVADGANVYNTPKNFDIPAGTVPDGDQNDPAYAIKKIVGGTLEGAAVGAYFDTTDLSNVWVAGGYSGSGVTLYASAFSGSGRTAAEAWNILVPVDQSDGTSTWGAASAITCYGLSYSTSGSTKSLGYEVQSLYPGTGYNEGTKSDGTTSGYSAQITRTGGRTSTLQVNRDGAAAEAFKVSLVASADYAEDQINTGTDNAKSAYIKASFMSGNDDVAPTPVPTFQSTLASFGVGVGDLGGRDSSGGSYNATDGRFNKFVEGTYALAGGATGDQGDDELIGSVTDKTGLYGLDDDTLNISLAVIPGNNSQTVQDTLITLAESTQNFLAAVSPPQGLTTVQQAIDWSNGQSDERTAALNSNFAAIYWPWVQTYDNFATIDRWYDPAIYAIRQMAYTDEVGDPWFAPAGVVRGRLTKPSEVEVSVNQGDRDTMYSGGNVINPIVNFPQQGIMIFGQRTAQREPTALDRVNVRRLMIQVKKLLLNSTRRFVFEPNDSTTWERIVGVVDPMMDDIRRRQGLVDYKVICDETTNTAVRVDRNEMWCKVLLKPTKAAEVVVFELNLTNQAAQI